MANYLTYPTEHMRITQNYNGNVSHKPNSSGKPADYPIDEGCGGTGRSWFHCPCDAIKIMRIYGVGGAGTNTIWLQSTDPVDFADGTKDYVTILVTHPDDDDLGRLKVGEVFYRGEKIFREGKDDCTGYHFHMSAAKGKYKAPGWARNTNNAWVLTNTGRACKPERLFYIDKTFTNVMNTTGLSFEKMPTKKYYTAYTGASSQIDTVFLIIGVPKEYRGSWSKRKKVASANGITAYVGSAAQNMKLIDLAKRGKLIKV